MRNSIKLRPVHVFAATALALATSLGSAAVAQDAPPPKVTVAAAITQDITNKATFIGKGEAVDKVGVVARVTGFLREIAVADGAEVKEGDLLFRIEPEQYEAAVAAQEALLAQAEANLTLTQVELARKQTLVDRGSIAQSELDVALANEKVAEAAIQSAKAAIDQAQLDLDYTEITAPFDGRIGRLQRSIGELVGPDTGDLVTLVSETPTYVTFSLSERQLTDVMQADFGKESPEDASTRPVYVELPNGTDLDEVGHLAFADNRIDQSTGSISVRALFDNTARMIVDGAFVKVSIESSDPVAKVLVPQAAVQRDQRGGFVLVVGNDNVVEQRYIETGEQVELSIVVNDGLQDGETVIVEGLQRVRPGVPVDPVLAGTAE